jgi:hypothetical protein
VEFPALVNDYFQPALVSVKGLVLVYWTIRASSKALTLTEDAQALQALTEDDHALADLSIVYIDSPESHFINQSISV